jgi:protein-tyrosine-phosphatase
MNILFICKYNRFRSKVAEGVFNKLNKNPSNKAKSAGIIIGAPIDPETAKAFEVENLEPVNDPVGLSTELLKWHDLAIIVANDVPKEILKDNKKYGNKLEIWNVPDAVTDEKEERLSIMKSIEEKVADLVERLK